jgi:probable F420-dependent oxidoreductase
VKLGVVFPQSEISSDAGAVREFAQAADELGYTHLLAFDHVIGADRSTRPDWNGPYDVNSLFHEVFVLFGFLAGLTTQLELTTGILILPQRQTVLVAKQAAEIDVLTNGRLRLGVGIGWNPVEYEALNENFSDRGRRSAEQVELLKLLWTEQSVTFTGRWHHVDAAGIKPLPVQRPIPVWFGGYQKATMERVARLGNGWICTSPPNDRVREIREVLAHELKRARRDPSTVGIEGQMRLSAGIEECQRVASDWKALGATHLSLNTMNAGLTSPQAHIDAIRAFKSEVEV